MSKTSPRGKKDLEPRKKLRLIKAVSGANKARCDKRRVRDLAVKPRAGANTRVAGVRT